MGNSPSLSPNYSGPRSSISDGRNHFPFSFPPNYSVGQNSSFSVPVFGRRWGNGCWIHCTSFGSICVAITVNIQCFGEHFFTSATFYRIILHVCHGLDYYHYYSSLLHFLFQFLTEVTTVDHRSLIMIITTGLKYTTCTQCLVKCKCDISLYNPVTKRPRKT